MAETPIAATYLSATSFSVASDKGAEFLPGVRVLADCGVDGTRMGTVTSDGVATVVVVLDSGVLTSHLTGVLHGNDTPDSLCNHASQHMLGARDVIAPSDIGAMPADRSISTTAPLYGGGDLWSDLTLGVDAASESAAGVAELATAAEVAEGTDTGRVITPAGLAAGYLGLSVKSEVSITGATTLTSSAFGKMHVCTDTAADYTVGLPAAAGNAGKLLGIRISSACTKLVTLDGNASELIDGAATRVMWAGESALLLCDGVGWTKVAGKSIPMVCRMQGQESQSIPSATFTTLALPTAIVNIGGMADAANNRVLIRRGGTYHVSAQSSLPSILPTELSGIQILLNGGHLVYGGGVGAFFGVTPTTDALASCSATAVFAVRSYHAHATSLPTGLGTFLNVTEIVSW